MNNITYAVSVDVNNPIIPYNVYVANVLDSNVRYLEITLYQNGNVIALSNEATATASLVTDDVLIDDSVACTISNNIITVPLEDLQRHGNLDVQVTVTEGEKVLAIPFPIQVRVTPNIAEEAQIDENSMGSYAEVVQEIAEARKGHDSLDERLNSDKTSCEIVMNKVQSIGSQSQTFDNDKYPSVTAVRDYVNIKTDDLEDHIESELDELDEAKADKADTAAQFERLIAVLQRKADSAETLAGYGINDAYTKAEVDALNSAKVDKADYTEEVGDLKSAIDDITDDYHSKNVFHTDAVVEGKYINYTNGSIGNNDKYFYTDYFEVEPETQYIGSWYNQDGTYNSIMTQFLTFYDEDKTFISGLTGSGFPGGVFTTPEGCKYAIYSGVLTTWDSLLLMIEKGNVPSTAYVAYHTQKIIKHSYILVDQSGLGNYKTVTEAVRNSQSGSVIVVNPGVYEKEVVEAWGKEVHIVGVSREQCIIKNALSTYSTPPIEMGAGTLENLTIIAEYGTGISSDQNGWPPYAVHTEDNNLANKTLTIRNCTLISELNAAFGLGMRGGCTVNVCDSSLVGRIGTGNRALYFHDADNSTYAGVQTINVCNCEMLSDSSTATTLRIIDQNTTGSTVNVRFVNNLLWNKAGTGYRLGTSVSGGATGSGWRNMINVVLDGASYGNSLRAMNT